MTPLIRFFRLRKSWLIALGLGLFALAGGYIATIHSFLAVTRPISGKVLIVESWFQDRPALREVPGRFRTGGYELVLCVSSPDPQAGAPEAELAAARLINLGMDPAVVAFAVSSENDIGSRTFGTGLAAREWLLREHPDVRSADVFSIGVHARKSRILISKALGADFSVGIIAGTEDSYPVERWWATTTGWYIVLRNTAGYLQAVLTPAPRASTN